MNGEIINVSEDKKVYEPAEIEVIAVQIEDVIATSVASGGFGGDDDLF